MTTKQTRTAVATPTHAITTTGTVAGSTVGYSTLAQLKAQMGFGTAADAATTDFATSAQGTSADTAFAWGDHATAGYLTTETDPVFTASASAGIQSTDITNWDTAFGWGDHALAGYVVDTDTRLTDNRDPNAHNTTHFTAGSDPITPADIGAATSAQGATADTALQPGFNLNQMGESGAQAGEFAGWNGTIWVPSSLAVTHATVTSTDIVVEVGTGGDHATINAALEELTQYQGRYKKEGFNAEIRLLADFVMEEQVLISGLDLGWIRITGVDAETVIDRAALDTEFEGRYPAFGVRRGTLVTIDQLFNMNTTGTAADRDGVFVNDSSRASVLAGAGVKNAGFIGMHADKASMVTVDGANFSGAAVICVRSVASFVSAVSAIGTGAGAKGCQAWRGGIINAASANFQRGVSPHSTDIEIVRFGLINADSATGGLSQTKNTVTANGIIFQP